MVGKLFPDHFQKNQNWAYFSVNSLKFYMQFVFIVCQAGDYQNILKLSCRPLAFSSYKAFLKKNKKRSRLLFMSHILHELWRKRFLLLYCVTWPSFIACLPLLREILGNMCIVIQARILAPDIRQFPVKNRFMSKKGCFTMDTVVRREF